MGLGKRRNKLCSCNSGEKFKNCCMENLKLESFIADFNRNNNQFKILNYTKNSTVDPSDPQYFYKTTLASICTGEEVNRIINCNNTKDYLLKLRADSINDNMRIFRTVLTHKKNSKNQWSLEGFFRNNDFNKYIDYLDVENKEKCSKLTAGYVFSNEPNGKVMKTDYGKVMIVSKSLRYFLYFMNLFHLDFQMDVPEEVRINSLRIAIRLMFQTESLDIEIDPRGEIPKELDYRVNESVNNQLQFVIGHEYAHFLLNHLDKRNTFVSPLIEMGKLSDYKEYEFYNSSQLQEFEADSASIELMQCNELEKEVRLMDAIHFFTYLSIYQHAREIVFPSMNRFKTHPSGEARIANIIKNYQSELKFITTSMVDETYEKINFIKGFLNEDIGYNFEAYEDYGSIYLGPWHKKMLRDRIDY
ncbi:M48 family metalloprotease [Bacillus mycoides]|uniref:M48 family metalloprotease n=1 Tax=Bacillus mycoides TaxID=1405 RepID=UPI000B4ABD96|nr:M48 family metalloprotease [Bacillus mycoides]